MEEIIVTGYCRAYDQSRMIEVEMVNGRPQSDCAYPDCPYTSSCLIAKELKAMEP